MSFEQTRQLVFADKNQAIFAPLSQTMALVTNAAMITSSMDLYSALATSTYSNIVPWLQARFNAFDTRVDNISSSGLGYLNYSLLSSMIPGSYVAASGRLFYSILSDYTFTGATTTALFQSTGYTDQDLLFNFDAGSFLNNYSYGNGEGIGSSYYHRLGAYPEDGSAISRLD